MYTKGYREKHGSPSSPEIIAAVMAVINTSAIGKPPFSLPHMALSGGFVDDSHPPVIANEYHHPDHPADHDPHHIIDTE